MTDRKATVAAAFGAAASRYDQAAGLQREVAGRLAGRLVRLPLPSRPRVLELGCGTGFLARALEQRGLEPSFWLLTDLAAPMVQQCAATLEPAPGRHFLVMDGERPCLDPVPGGGFDLICSSLAFQWFEQLERSLAQLARLLAPGGVLAYAMPSTGTFGEWRAAHQALGLSCGVPEYPSPAALGRLWPGGGAGGIEHEPVVRHYADGRAFLHDLKQIGAQTPRAGHRPLSPGELRRVLRQLEGASGVDVTYHVSYGTFSAIGAAGATGAGAGTGEAA